MTNRDDTTILECLQLLVAAYPRQELPNKTIDVYEAGLSDIDPSLLKAAVLQCISGSKWFPTIAELRQAAASLIGRANGEMLPGEAWEHVTRKFRQGYGHNRVPDFSDQPLVAKTLQAIGGWHYLCLSENVIADRARFLQIYEAYQQRQADDAMMLPVVNEFVAHLQAGNGGVSPKVKLLAAKMRGGQS